MHASMVGGNCESLRHHLTLHRALHRGLPVNGSIQLISWAEKDICTKHVFAAIQNFSFLLYSAHVALWIQKRKSCLRLEHDRILSKRNMEHTQTSFKLLFATIQENTKGILGDLAICSVNILVN